jgi:hypothetical protein
MAVVHSKKKFDNQLISLGVLITNQMRTRRHVPSCGCPGAGLRAVPRQAVWLPVCRVHSNKKINPMLQLR